MGSILCCPCRTIAKLFNPSKDYGKVLGCLPLALFGLICSVVLCGWGAWDMYFTVTNPNWADFDLVMALIVACIKAFLGLMGLVAIACRWAPGVACLAFGYKVLTASILFSFIVTWVIWIVDLVRGFQPEGEQIRYMIVFSVLHLLFLIFSYWILSAFASLHKVLSVGGDGWEVANWKEIVGEQVVREEGYS